MMGKRAAKTQSKDLNMKTVPRQSVLIKEEAFQVIEDNDFGFRVPSFSEVASKLNLGRQFEKKPSFEKMEENEKMSGDLDIVMGDISFEDIGVHPKLIKKLQKEGITSPVLIQERALPLIYSNKSILIKSETGSGKTLVFLLPTLQDPGKSYGTVIVVPTRELASQMLYKAHRLLGDKSIVASFVSGVDLSSQEKRLQDMTNPPRIVIGTPKRLLEIVEANESLFLKTKRIVVDEVDKILLPLHKRASQKMITNRVAHPRSGRLLVEKIAQISKVPKKQFIGASATVNISLLEDLVDMGWGDHVTVVQSPSYEGKLRSIPSCIRHRYTYFNEETDPSKAHVLVRTFQNSKQKSALVFIHRNLSVDDFVWELRYMGFKAAALYRKIASQNPLNHEHFLADFHSGKIQLVVGTEETVRGLDFKDLEHVYLMEVPKNTEEYLHLAGRVGRQGKEGTVTTIVSKDPRGGERRMLLQYRRLAVPFQQI
ncbi:DEAD-box ATP-dependent RNA helicase 47A-like isoform X2 [Actinia tenebrosa]|nr:DEAD-box ATP-dependent RNA helicase 47A-like isoform X2 [Actinia tenebrosa]